MIIHYLKVAIRNLLKYKTQSIVSIVGLAIGFACFALANLWIHYEMTYDCQFDGADRFYLLYKKDLLNDTGYSTRMPYPTSNILKKNFPEVEDACAYMIWDDTELKLEGSPTINTSMLLADSCFMKMFGITLLAGNMDFLHNDSQIALTKDMAMKLFGSVDVLGKELTVADNTVTIEAILEGLQHSNLAFGCWGRGAYFHQWQDYWGYASFQICAKLKKGISAENFQRKLNASEYKGDSRDPDKLFEGVGLMPLTQYHYSEINEKKSIKFLYLIFFSIIGGLVISCSLFNYLSLFITRLNIRNKELELRRMCGSSIRGILALFMIEYGTMILLAGIIGMALVEITLPIFREMSGITGNIYYESLLYFIGLLLLSLILLLPFALRRTVKQRKDKRFFIYRCSILFQIFISILFLFCMSILMKQIYHLTHTDLGWERHNIAAFPLIYPHDNYDEIAEKIAQIPCTSEVLKGHHGLFPRTVGLSLQIKDWDGRIEGAEGFEIQSIIEGKEIIDFYNLDLIEGEAMKEEETDKVILNETAVKFLGMTDPIGKKLYLNEGNVKTIIGIVRDFHITAPTIPVNPIMLIGNHGFSHKFWGGRGDILVKFHEGKWKELKNEIENLFSQSYPTTRYKFVNVEEGYEEYLKSEKVLMKLISFVSMVCILITIFGIFSLITLSCEQRRKEIAVRKVNGATTKNIMTMFIKEYMLLLIFASTIAFPIGYVLMNHWLESYVRRTSINLWIYTTIFVGIAIIILLCIGWRVWQAAQQNPAEVIKSE